MSARAGKYHEATFGHDFALEVLITPNPGYV